MIVKVEDFSNLGRYFNFSEDKVKGNTDSDKGENADLSSKLSQATVPIKQLNYCKTQYPTKLVTSRMICYGYQGGQIDSCKGDSGGPFVCKDN
ncbi:hypothetical protein QZH41_008524 [Actinostola sp. cb2023]|nr:hypothetical protein QZH41_008524 [Actinostola sp. cb2023]